MTKTEAASKFQSEALPYVTQKYEQDGIPDRTERQKAWKSYLFHLHSRGEITSKQIDKWKLPKIVL